jgi:hypothetical protein
LVGGLAAGDFSPMEISLGLNIQRPDEAYAGRRSRKRISHVGTHPSITASFLRLEDAIVLLQERDMWEAKLLGLVADIGAVGRRC